MSIAQTRKFSITNALLAACSGAHYDGENIAQALHLAGFHPIPLGGVRVLEKTFATDVDADAYVAACITPILGQEILRDRTAGAIVVRACIPLWPEGGDRTKLPVVQKWCDLPFDLTWWRAQPVTLPANWTDAGLGPKRRPLPQRGPSHGRERRSRCCRY